MTPVPATVVIAVDSASCRLGSTEALRGITLDVRAGAFTGIIGPNGAGKTTLLRMIAGLVRPSAGTVSVAGRAPASTPPAEMARLVALLPQHPASPAGLTVREAVAWGRIAYLPRLRGLSAEDLAATDHALARTGMVPFADRPLDTLSGGEHQRALIARALAQRPRILLLDEPTLHLDVGHQIEIMTLLRDLGGDGVTVVAALHDLRLAATFCGGLVLLHHGRLVRHGAPAEVLRADVLAGAFGPVVAGYRVDASTASV